MKHLLPLPVLLLLTHFVATAQLDCRTASYEQTQLQQDPLLAGKVREIADFTRSQLQRRAVAVTGTGQGSQDQQVITIPVVVHIIYTNSQQNISDAQVKSQIAVLNRDYRKMNPDTAGIPGYFRSLAADCGIQFALANLDTNGAATTGIVRKYSATGSFTVNDNIKFADKGGDNAWDRDRYLNIWVGNLSGGILGYSSILGCDKSVDGVVINYTAFGTMGTAALPFNLGRTATHEIGHWLNLIHIWGDSYCGNDQVDDTPPQQTSTSGNPSGIIPSCNNGPYGNMYMNYMDFTDDAGMHMFTDGQKARMRTVFAPGGFRNALLSSNGLSGAPVTILGKQPQPAPSGGQILKVYPNPAVGMVNVVLSDGASDGALMEVYNQLGQLVMTVRITSLNFQFNTAGLTPGIYFLRINGGKTGNGYRLIRIG